ncbi:MAG: multidrug effflux MFS transporter [Amaricoccus sp.]|uniref:multidrug effflux MFS transporter n=1 Tax=Amaricoccus sp. TaxID=1872485 RepID=UPI0033151DC9
MPKDTNPIAREEAGSPAPVWLDRRTPPHVVTLVLIAGLSALNMNMILPALPELARHFGADYSVAALAVSAYLGLTGLLQLGIGPMSDRFGRRPVLLWTFAIFLVATIGCALAPSMEIFLAFRMAQATVASGIVLSRVIVRDTVPADEAASQIGYVTMGMSLMPMLSPVAGGYLAETLGWASVMLATFAVGVAVFALAWADLGETNLAPSASLVAQIRSYPELLRSRPFWGYALTATLASGAFFAFLGGGPWVATEVLGMSASALGFYFGLIALGYLVGNFLSGRFASRVGLNGMMLMGGVVTTLALVALLGQLALGVADPALFFGTLGFVGVGNGLLLPSANAGIVSAEPRLAGSASGLAGALMIGGGAVLAALAGAMLRPGSGAWPLVWLMLICSALGLVTTLWVSGLRVTGWRA